MDAFELVASHFQRMQLDRQETPIKKTKEAEFTSAETTNQTPEKPVPDDIDPQYLFEHFDELVKVEFDREVDTPFRDVRMQLSYDEEGSANGLFSPPTKENFESLLSPSSMKKKKSDRKPEHELVGIELFPVEERVLVESPPQKMDMAYRTLKKPLLIDESRNVLVRKQPYNQES